MTATSTSNLTAVARLVLHVGPGLPLARGEHCPQLSDMAYPSVLRVRANNAAGELLARLPTEVTRVLVAPDAAVPPQKAVHAVLTTYRAVLAGTESFEVVLFNDSVLNELLNILVDAGRGDELLVCLHQAEGTTLHTLTDEGYLGQGWPFGILGAAIDDNAALRELGFAAKQH